MEEKCRSTTGKKFHIHWTVPLLALQSVRVLVWGGVENGKPEGAIRHQTTNNHLVLVVSLNKTLGSFSHAVDGMDGKEANLTNFRKIVQSLKVPIIFLVSYKPLSSSLIRIR
jgi:hypothetical protein